MTVNRRQVVAGMCSMSMLGLPLPAQAKGIPGLYWPDTFRGHISLTFDDGPHPSIAIRLWMSWRNMTSKLLFVCGRRVVAWPDVIKECTRRPQYW